MAIFRLVMAFILSIGQFFNPFWTMLFHGIDSFYEEWSPDMAYTEDYAVTLEKDPNKDFVVLNFADVQLEAEESYGDIGKFAEETMRRAIEEVKPDLITFTGDNAWSKMSYIRVIEFIDSFGIPWAPVMGNHDGKNGKKVAENWCALQIVNAENSIFKFGPEGMGVGNYIINIAENGKVIHSLYMVDTHSATDRDCGGYDHLWDNQLQWYEWAVKGNNALAGKTVESSIFFHIPCIQYRYAWNEAKYNVETGEYENPDYADSFGYNTEWICSPEYDSGFFDLVKELGSTKNMIAGHDHVNCSSIMYQGVRLSYSLKTGSGCYWDNNMNGGSTLSIDSTGKATFAHHYVDADSVVID